MNFGAVTKREMVAAMACGSGLIAVMRSITRKKTNMVPILAYHGIEDLNGGLQPSQEALSVSFENFKEQLRYISGYYRTVTFQELKKALSETDRQIENLLLITFDDGYRNNYDIALPLLKEYGLKATVFVSTGYLDRGDMFWFEKVYFLIKRTAVRRIDLPSPLSICCGLDSEQERDDAVRFIKKALKSMDDRDRNRCLEYLCTQLDWEAASKGLPRMTMTWDEAAEMSGCGMEIASHTVTHPILTSVSDEALDWEFRKSKTDIEARTGRECVCVAYPDGAFDTRVKEAARRAGYSFAVTYRHGLYDIASNDRFEADRVAVEKDFSMSLFKMNLVMPGLWRASRK